MKQHPQDYIYIRDSFHSLQSYIESEVLKEDRKAWTLLESGRNYILIEKDPDYCKIIERRLKSVTMPMFVM